ncbi:DUF6174 domain-containing protein [Marinimicrobium sp. C6131]|uniref:DUF6174 domain-containing protein n=1 Tax=Marinimicrobium sp. C6131 TaxID=3022676 RepID=UPI00223E8482|nr:DUF6174 domain-containing protein [Marinimicrobium sp. C6131]UZJ44575.1 DUF6174 domain-containing protein [Marinimicrobium sp. C6131]
MHKLMISMNIASNGQAREPEALLELRRRVRDVNTSPEEALYVHWQLWQMSGFDSYQFTLSRCGSVGCNDIRVKVSGGAVISAHELGSGRLCSAAEVGTVDDYFRWIEAELYGKPRTPQTVYHPLYGYPLSFALEVAHTRQEQERQLA